MADEERIAETIRTLLGRRAAGATICPSEVARALAPADWRPLMPRVRAVAATLAAAGEVELRQRGERLETLDGIRGPIRIALAAPGGHDGGAG
ncbi:DUF3253 domain-containing protein [Roseisolibacter sp. H3M3-2]|uniref:DUF3253 domain-containing protein n=1 Tax=Roseisolibacter sp. H3M3-2 TaxID=3031323 RepID=UPI0023D9D5C9|nr:DUF3253 domain-containing protein [Roseisolibacter sp. H3M3-2]MDF1503623.1 DUF3253 domain-containing protein [Roseisolibacter sp. H3M3-2]